MHQVVTYLPNRDYDDLYKTAKSHKIYSEIFNGDPVETKMWIQDGKLLSQMKGDLRIKQIKPLREMNPEKLTPESGFAKSVMYLVNQRGIPFEVASNILLQLYAQFKISKEMELPKSMMDSIQKVN